MYLKLVNKKIGGIQPKDVMESIGVEVITDKGLRAQT